MESMHLTPRLALAASFVPEGARLADIGTDHGKLPVSLLLSGRVRAAVGSDIRPGPLAHAARNAREHGVTLPLRLAPGLDGVTTEECDTITIAGMGGETIAGILRQAPWALDGRHLLILQAMTMLPMLRCWLAENGCMIEAERICREGRKFYVVTLARGGSSPWQLSPLDSTAPAWLSADPLAKDYFTHLLRREEAMLHGLEKSRAPEPEALEIQRRLVNGLRARMEGIK
ncbi:SAM-dependent methyltransferase [Butyricicoccus sp. 1XD8-22]|nr:SAM-dependent methyltransferase [Butyricicoccus sp. 1XD8-22]